MSLILRISHHHSHFGEVRNRDTLLDRYLGARSLGSVCQRPEIVVPSVSASLVYSTAGALSLSLYAGGWLREGGGNG